MISKLCVFMKHIKRLKVALLIPTHLIAIDLKAAVRLSMAIACEASSKA